ncbi:hypothetical protein HA402_009589 [Bradysia odoriphaga]|nr:hypothetical protein HA402_009589 [Bradysia odoriphaga]
MYVNNESSGVKASRSMGSKYGDEAIGRVQVKHATTSCNVIASVTPEHKIEEQPYKVVVNIDVKNQKVRSAELCYWKKSVLASVDTSKPYHSDTDESSAYSDSEEEDSDGFISSFATESEKVKVTDCHFLLHYNFKKFSSPFLKLSLHHCVFDYMISKASHSPSDFISFCKERMSQSLIEKIAAETRGQYKPALWRELRYGRITGSLVYEVAHCKTGNGSTIDKLFGEKILDTKYMKRGRLLKAQVKLALEKKLGQKIADSDLWLKSDLPIFGASPDGFGPRKEYCVEIKCPAIEDSYKTQLQMHITNTYKTKFCLADPHFERNGKIEVIEVNYDRDYVLKELITPCLKFWNEYVYAKICAVAKD